MKLSRRRSQQGHPTGSGFITGHRSDSVKSLVKAANWECENDRCLELGSSNSRFPEEQAYLLEAISNVRPSSAITSMNKLGKVDLKSGASNPFHKKLEIKVHNLIEQRKRLVSRLQQENLLSDNGTESTQPLIPSASKTSVESDAEKQVNFVFITKSEDVIDCGSVISPKNIVKRKQNHLSATSILTAYLLERPALLKQIFVGPNDGRFRINITLDGSPKSLVVEVDQDNSPQPRAEELCSLLVEKASQWLEHSTLTSLFEMFVPVNGYTIDLGTETHSKVLGKDCSLYVQNHLEQYLRVTPIDAKSVEVQLSQDGTIQSVSWEYLRFVYQQLYVLEGIDSPMNRQHLKLTHYPNHFNIVTLTLKQNSTVRLITRKEEQTHLVLTNTRTKQIQGLLMPKERCLEMNLEKGEYELYVSSAGGTTRLVCLSDTIVKLSVRHKEEYRTACQQLVKDYLNKRTLSELCSCSKPIIIRCELFIGFAAQVICNPTKKPLDISLEYPQSVLCDLNYRKASVVLEVPPMQHYILPLKRLTNVICDPLLPHQTRRI